MPRPHAKHKPVSLSSQAATPIDRVASPRPKGFAPTAAAAAAAALPDETAAFRPLPYSRGASRHVTVAAVEQAKLRMLASAPGASKPPPLDEEASDVTPAVPAPRPHFVTGISTAPLPAPAVAPPVVEPAPSPLVAAPVLATVPTIEEIDRLWDWVRADGDGGAAFFSRAVPSSVALHQTFAALDRSEREFAASEGITIGAMIRSVTCGEYHIGFAMLLPVLRAERTALMHIYLRPELRGMLAQLTPVLVERAAAAVPDYTLAVIATDPALSRMHRAILTPIGFTEHTMFLRQP